MKHQTLAGAFALVRALDPSLDEPAVAKLYTQAQGIPFWLDGLARYGRSPGGLEQVLTRRLRGAGAEAATVLGALALAGRPLPLTEAAHHGGFADQAHFSRTCVRMFGASPLTITGAMKFDEA